MHHARSRELWQKLLWYTTHKRQATNEHYDDPCSVLVTLNSLPPNPLKTRPHPRHTIPNQTSHIMIPNISPYKMEAKWNEVKTKDKYIYPMMTKKTITLKIAELPSFIRMGNRGDYLFFMSNCCLRVLFIYSFVYLFIRLFACFWLVRYDGFVWFWLEWVLEWGLRVCMILSCSVLVIWLMASAVCLFIYVSVWYFLTYM